MIVSVVGGQEQNNNERKYISEEVGEDYKNWKNANKIFINAPTGSGKSYFILHNFLKEVMMQGGKLLYLVNRRILKKQIEEDLNDIFYRDFAEEGVVKPGDSSKDCISVRTYQSIENGLKGNDPIKLYKDLTRYSCVVYDEVHYFYADSNFNTDTELSYDCLRHVFSGKIEIFLSATIKNVEKCIKSRRAMYLPIMDEWKRAGIYPSKEYNITPKYDYIDIISFGKLDELIPVIKDSGKDKWLIFVDNIAKGENLKKDLVQPQGIPEGEVVFIDADYEKNIEAMESVQELAVKDYISKKIVISTAVMDNGISFIDRDLENIVIMADNEESFIQMLGRKRRDGKRIKLFVPKRNITHFQKRKREVRNVLDIYDKYVPVLKKIYSERDCNGIRYESNAFLDLWFSQQIIQSNTYKKEQVASISSSAATNTYIYNIPLIVTGNWEDLYAYVESWKRQQGILDMLLKNSMFFQYATKIVYSVQGVLSFNSFAVQKYLDLNNFYGYMIESLKEDEDAFIKKQLEWLGLSDSDIKVVPVENAFRAETDGYHSDILQNSLETLNFLKQEGKVYADLDSKGVINWKKDVRRSLVYFLNKSEGDSKSKDVDNINKTDRPIRPDKFNACMIQAKLPYRMEKPDQKTFRIVKEEKND